MAIGGTDPTILVSRGMVSLLERDEAETVIAHEVMHLKHHDAEFKVFSRVLSRILFFDPFSKFFDPAVHREREYLADEMGARSSGRPAALASALLKIASRGVPQKASWGLSILGPARGSSSDILPYRSVSTDCSSCPISWDRGASTGQRLNTIQIVILREWEAATRPRNRPFVDNMVPRSVRRPWMPGSKSRSISRFRTINPFLPPRPSAEKS